MDIEFMINGLVLEAASEDISLSVRGNEMKVDSVDKLLDTGDGLTLLSRYYDGIRNIQDTYCILVDKNNKVIKISDSKMKVDLEEGFIVLGHGKGADFLKDNFKSGHIVKLRLKDEVVDIDNVTNRVYKHKEDLEIKGEELLTVESDFYNIELELIGIKDNKNYEILINDKSYNVEESSISTRVKLAFGVNYFNISLLNENLELVKKNLIIYRRKSEAKLKDNILWIDQFPSALMLNSIEDIDNILRKAKKAGFTASAIDVKGPEGYVSYKNNDLSNSPYLSEIQVAHKKGMNKDNDMFKDFIDISKKYGLKVYAAINVMTEGNLVANDYPLIDKHKDWEEIIQRPEDKGKLLKVSESCANNILLYINPANDEAIDFQLKRYEEVLKNYDVDGVVLDRCRYDNCYADFSDITRVKFEHFLEAKGKKLKLWPNDVFKIKEDGSKVEGVHYLEWWTFRSAIIKEVAGKIKALVNKYSDIKSRNIEFASYVGSWYDLIYENGINWASKDFEYNRALAFGEDRIYTKDYYETSYIEYLDFIMIGTYYKTAKEINSRITVGNILIREEIPIMAGMSIPDLGQGIEQKEVYNAAMESCNGTMTFDLSYIDFNKFKIK